MPRALLPCGTWAAYKRHLKAAETPCDACVEASREHGREQYARTDPEVWRARDRAKRAERKAAREARAAAVLAATEEIERAQAARGVKLAPSELKVSVSPEATAFEAVSAPEQMKLPADDASQIEM